MSLSYDLLLLIAESGPQAWRIMTQSIPDIGVYSITCEKRQNILKDKWSTKREYKKKSMFDYEDGNRIVEYTFSHGTKMYKEFWKSSDIPIIECMFTSSSENLKDGFYLDNLKLIGRYREWYRPSRGGKLLKICYYNSKGNLDGFKRIWYPNGNRKMESYYSSSGELNGEYKEWYVNGEKREESNYSSGNLDGEYREWHANGIKQEISIYKNGHHIGKCEKWFDNGKKKSEMHYNSEGTGKKHGPYIKYWTTGDKNVECTCKDGRMDGKYKEWYHPKEGGGIHCDCNYSQGMLKGRFKTWDPMSEGGKLCEELFY